jgi:iron complex transport system ATP-binding protein
MRLSFRGAGFRWHPRGPAALEDFTATFDGPLVAALVGANGAGKSTLLRLASGLLAPLSGAVELDGVEPASMEARRRALRVAFLPQSERLPFAFRVLDFVLMGRSPCIPGLRGPGAADLAAARAALERVGADAFADRPVAELSAGELQTVRLARVLAQDTPFVALDEPTATLDPARAAAVADLIRALADRDRLVLFAAHDLAFARHAADRVLVLKGGRLLEDGAPGRVLAPATLERAYGTRFVEASLPVPAHGGVPS